MSYKLPYDVVEDLKEQFPEVDDMEELVHKFFAAIVDKTLTDGSCLIRELGKFYAYVTYSNKINAETIRMKFRLAPSLNNKIKSDKYLIEHLPVRDKTPFTEKNEELCQDKRDQKRNQKIISQATANANRKTNERKTKKVIHDILDE